MRIWSRTSHSPIWSISWKSPRDAAVSRRRAGVPFALRRMGTQLQHELCVTIVASGHDASLQWSIALRDLDTAIGLDTNDDGDITWGELRGRHTVVDAYALSRLR